MQRLHGKSRQRAKSLLTAAVFGALCAPGLSRAADLFWDANGGTAGTGGSGNWLTPSNVTNWHSGGTGGPPVNWTDGNNAVFPTAAGNVTFDGAVSATGLVFQVSAYTLTGANTLTLTGTPKIDTSATNGAFNVTINNPLSSSVLVTFDKGASTGIHMLNIGGTNTFTGGCRFQGDSYRFNLGAAGALGGATGGTITVVGNNNSFTTASGGSGPTGTFVVSNNFALNPNNTSNFLTAFSGTKIGMVLDFAGQISGSSDVVVDSNPVNTGSDGDGMTIFSHTANAYTGKTIINNTANGAVRIAASGAIPATSDLVFGRAAASGNNVGMLDLFGNDITVRSLSTNLGTGNTAVGITNSNGGSGGTINITGSQTTTFSSVIGAVTNTTVTGGTNVLALHLTSAHTGSLALSGVNTYTGATTIDGGTLVLAHTADASNTLVSNVTVNINGALASAAGNQATTGRSGGSVIVNNGGRVSPGTDGGIGTLVAASLDANGGSGLRFDLASTSNYDVLNLTGALTLDTGAHTIDIFGSPTAGGNYTLITAGSTNLDLTHLFTLGNQPAGFGYGLTQSGNSVVLNVTALAPSLVWDIGGAGTPIVDGAGTWGDGSTDFSDVSSNVGATFHNADPYDVTFGNNIANSGGIITLSGNVRVGGKLVFGPINDLARYQLGVVGSTETLTTSAAGLLTNSSGSIEARVILEASQDWSSDSGTTLTVNGVVSDNGASATLTKAGAGTLLLGAANTFTGGVNINAGTLAITNGGGAGPGTIAITNATLRTTANMTVGNPVTLAGAGGTVSVDTATTSTFTGSISGTGALTKSGAGTAVLSGTNSFNGLVLSNGTLAAAADSALGSGGLTVNSGAILKAMASFATPKAVTLPSGNGRFDTNGFDLTLSGNISGAGQLLKEGAGTLVLSGNNSYTGQTQFPATTGGGTIETLSSNALGGAAASNFLILNNGTLRTTNDLVVSAIRGNAFTLTKEGTGMLTVTGTSNGSNLNAGAAIVVNAGSVRMDSLTGLGGNNSASAVQMPITLNAGTELLVNWSTASESRFSKNITLNDATLTRVNGAAGGDVAEFTTYSGTNNLNGVMTVGGISFIRNQEVSTGPLTKNLQIQMPVVVSSGATLTLSSANNNGDYAGHRVILRGVAKTADFPNDAVTLQPSSTLVMSGPGETAIGNTNSAGKPVIGQGTPGSEATLKLGAHAYLNDKNNGVANITRLVVAGTGSAGLRVEAPMNATYIDRDTLPSTALYDGSTGLFGINSTSTMDGGTPPVGFSVIANAYTVLSPKRLNQLSDPFGSPAVTLGGRLTVAATDAAGATGTLDNGPAAATPITLALDNAPTSGNLVYKLLPSANGGRLANFAGLTVQRSNGGAGTVTARIDPDGTATGVLRTPAIAVTGARLDLSDNHLITQSAVGAWTGSAYDGVSGLIQSGRTTSNNWSGNGIVTSQTNATNASNYTSIGIATGAQVLPNTATETALWAGQTVTGTDTLVMYTYGGDANLDGKINIDDYGHIDTSIGIGLKGWSNGDFNYDGTINIDDYGIIDVNVGIQGPAFFTGAGVGGISGVVAVPEPASVLGAAVAFASLTLRRRRQHYA
jgi:autotransporter-associated beta strand protein